MNMFYLMNLTKGQNFVLHCCQKRQKCHSNIRLCQKNRAICSIRQCCFDTVAGVDGALH